MRKNSCCLIIGFSLLVACSSGVFAQSYNLVRSWGSQLSGNGQFNEPCGVAVDSGGNVYVVDYGNSRIQKFSSSGAYLTQWGSPGSGDGQFSNPVGVAVDSGGNVYVVDAGNNRIQKFSSSGAYLTQWGSPGTWGASWD